MASTPQDSAWRVKAPLLVLVAGVCWGCISLFSQALAAAGLTSLQITAARCFFTAVVLALVLVVCKRDCFRIQLRDLWMFVGSGVLSISFFNVCYFACMQECSVSIAAVLLYTAPCFVTVLARVFFKEALTKRKVACLVVAFCGCALVAGIGSTGATATPLGVALGLGSGIGYALYSIFGTMALKKYSPFTFAFYTFVFAAVAMLVISQPVQIAQVMAADYTVGLVALGLAVLCTAVPFTCYTVGLQHMEASKASILAFVEPLVALLVGAFVFHDVLTPLNMVGICCILAAVVALSLKK
ncbi:MAG: EamA family transporter [Coriobacteriia bacterium]|nr:EamA family transporter [Coriobacteriia bacterium]